MAGGQQNFRRTHGRHIAMPLASSSDYSAGLDLGRAIIDPRSKLPNIYMLGRSVAQSFEVMETSENALSAAMGKREIRPCVGPVLQGWSASSVLSLDLTRFRRSGHGT